MFRSDLLYEIGNLVQLRKIENFGSNLTLVFTFKIFKIFLSTTDSNDMRPCLGIFLSKR